jgi:nucleotide-binding universal stress UspA family protein
MIKSILIPLDPSPYTDNAIKIGSAVAKMYDAHLTGLVVLDIEGIEKQIGPVPLGASYYAEHLEEKHKKHAQERIDKLVDNFEKKCKEAGVNYSVARNQGSPSERILHESIYYDMVITGLRTYYNFETSDKPGDSLDKILSESITPVYGVPEVLQLPDTNKEKIKVLIPFNASPASARAMQRMCQLMAPDMAEPRLLMSHDDEEIARASLENAKRYIELHGFENVVTYYTDQNIIDACKIDHLDWADVVVVGAHSKHGIFDFMVGSLTNYLIKLNKKPVLIGQ